MATVEAIPDEVCGGPRTLVCCTVSAPEFGGYDYATLELTPKRARRLLGLRAVVALAKTVSDQFYAAEFWDYSVTYGKNANHDDDKLTDLDSGEWGPMAADSRIRRGRTSAETVQVTDAGVLWTAYPKHGDGQFETVTLTWALLEAVARGEWPFSEETPDAG